MNNKVTFPKLASLLADKSGRSKRFSEDFLRELFAIISEQLETGESVKVKGLGTFRLLRVEPRKSVDVTTGQPMEISGHSKVVFTPAKELAEAVNAPFEAFSAIEIDGDMNLEGILEDADVEVKEDGEEIILSSSEDEASAPAHEPETKPKFEEKTEPEPEQYVAYTPQLADDAPQSLLIPTSPSLVNEDDDVVSVIDEPGYPANKEAGNASFFELEQKRRKSNWVKYLLAGVGCAALAVLLTFVIWSFLTKPDFSHVNDSDSDILANYGSVDHDALPEPDIDDEMQIEPEVSPELVVEDEIQEDVPTQPSDAVVYDTIGTKRYLTTMAKDHYGNNKFWPYIYEENKDRIGHPDKIRPGTPIVIPKLSKYGVDPTNKTDEEKANKLGTEIYARYGKSI